MAAGFGRCGPTHPRLGAVDARIARPLLTGYAGGHQFYGPESAYAHERGVGFVNRLRRGETLYFLESHRPVMTVALLLSRCRKTRAST
jgi:hypothetical protein